MNYVKIDVDFYNEEEKQLFKKNWPLEFNLLKNLTSNIVRVSFPEFKTYSQFHHQNIGIPAFSSYQKISTIKDDLYGTVKTYTNYDSKDEKLTSQYDHNNEQTTVSESIGNAGALSVLSKAYGMTQADWKRIDIQKHKDFDFDSSVIDGCNKLIVVEAKGSIVPDNMKKHARISQHKTKIKAKKEDDEFKKNYPHGAHLLIGMITALDPNNIVKVWLVDPPLNSTLDPLFMRKIKLLKRLKYYQDYLLLISKRSNLTIILTNRIRALEKLSDVSLLNAIKLVSSNKEPVYLSDNFKKNHSYLENEIMGNFIIINDYKAMFIGFPIELYNLLTDQDHDDILTFKSDEMEFKSTINCSLPFVTAQKSMFIKKSELVVEKSSNNKFNFKAVDVDVVKSSSGFTFSILEPKNLSNTKIN